MTKKLLIPLVILAVVLATGLGIYIASNQSAQPSTSQTDTTSKNELAIKEIERTITLSQDLEKLTYVMDEPSSILFYSDTYEKLDGCAGKHLGELQLAGATGTNAPLPEKSVAVGGQYQYGTFIAQPLGECGGDAGKALANTLAQNITKAQ